jgi:hypothetical protein
MSSATTHADELQLMWKLAPGDVGFLTTGNTERGIAYNKATGHLLVSARGDGFIHILDGETGAELGTLNNGDGIISGGTYAMNMVGVTDHGIIYLGNLSTSTTAPNLKLYRWDSETADAPILVYEGDPANGTNVQRWGDSLAVRGTADNTQILLGARNGSVAALITTTDGVTYTPVIVSNASVSGAISVDFGPGNTFFTKLTGAAAREVSFNPETGEGTVLNTIPIGNSVVPIGVNVASNWLAGVEINRSPVETLDNLILYNIADRNAPAPIDQKAFDGTADNANYVGDVEIVGNVIYALDTNNGLVAYKVVPSVNPPSFANQPVGAAILEGGFGSLSATLIGTPPFTYQWQLNGANVSGATNETLTFTNFSGADVGNYTLVVSNSAGSTNSEPAEVTLVPSVRSNRAAELWTVKAGSRPYITTGNTERGMAYNSVSNHVLVVSRTGSVDIHVLDGDTGADLWTMNAPSDIVTGSNPGGFRLNMVDVADDGVVYAANLTTGASDTFPFTIYRWDDDGTNSLPVVAFTGGLNGERYGDNLTVRGSGVDTQIIAASRFGTAVTIFTTADGINFFPTTIDYLDAAPGNFGLGVAFGEGNTFWGKALGEATTLRHVDFDLGSGTGTILQSYTNFSTLVAAIAVNTSSNMLAGLSFETPDNVRLYDLSDTNNPVLIDQDFFPTDNSNINGTGAIAFAGDRIYALDSNNGILALKLNVGTSTGEAASFSAPSVSGDIFSFTLTGTANASYKVQYSTDLEAWTDLKTVTAGGDGKATVTDTAGEQYRFYRAVAE